MGPNEHGGGLAKAATKCPPLSPFLGCAQLFYGLSGAAITGGLEDTAVAMALPWPKKSYSPRHVGTWVRAMSAIHFCPAHSMSLILFDQGELQAVLFISARLSMCLEASRSGVAGTTGVRAVHVVVVGDR